MTVSMLLCRSSLAANSRRSHLFIVGNDTFEVIIPINGYGFILNNSQDAELTIQGHAYTSAHLFKENRRLSR